ncbi:MAG: T9SS type A sorting domain-containing protein [Bacteroidota bacterium]|nr:T9SS type A sorting domain-containing protein [Bacteroidota bacterium]
MKKIVLLHFILFSVAVFSQAPDKFYSKYGGGGVDIGNGLKETYDKQYVLIGSTTSFGFGSADAYLLLVDSMGQLIWQKTFGGNLADVGKNIIINPIDSGFIFTGFTSSFGNGGYDVYVVRTDKNGNLIWQASFGGIDWDFGNDLVLSVDGNIIVCGNTYSMGYGKSDGYLLKININNGGLMWQKYFGGVEDDFFTAIKVTSDGKYAVGGNSNNFGDLNGDFWFFKVGIAGDSIISKKISLTNKLEYCYDLIEDDNFNLVFCGSLDTSYNNVKKNISYLIKTDLNGTFISEFKNPGGYTDDDKFSSITKSKNGNSYCMARKVENGFFTTEIQPFLINTNYLYLATATYGGNLVDEANKIIFTSDNGYALVGFTNSFGSLSEDVFFVKLDFSVQNAVNIVSVKQTEGNIIPGRITFFNNVFSFENGNNRSLKCKLYNTEGILIEEGITNNNEYNLKSNIPAGIYLFRLENDFRTGFLKFIKE